jgi:hypothetical protein
MTPAQGISVIEYNWFKNGVSDAIHPGGGPGSPTIRYNLFENMMYVGDAHADFIQTIGQVGKLDIEFNTFFQDAANSQGFPGAINAGIVRIGDQFGSPIAGATIAYNSAIGKGSTGHLCGSGTNCAAINNYFQIGTDGQAGSYLSNLFVHDNYVDTRNESYGLTFYPLTAALTTQMTIKGICGNVDLSNGNGVGSPDTGPCGSVLGASSDVQSLINALKAQIAALVASLKK